MWAADPLHGGIGFVSSFGRIRQGMMPHFYFHQTSIHRQICDDHAKELGTLNDACDQAQRFIHNVMLRSSFLSHFERLSSIRVLVAQVVRLPPADRLVP